MRTTPSLATSYPEGIKRMPRHFATIALDMNVCTGIDAANASGRQVFDLLKQVGCSFFNFSPQYRLKDFDDKSDGSILPSTEGNILPNAGLFHSTLAQSARVLKGVDPADLPSDGDGNFCFWQSIRHFSVNQNFRYGDVQAFEESVQRQTLFFKILAPGFRPEFSWIDEFGERVGVTSAMIAKKTIKRLFWYNVFGPTYCGKFGKGPFLNAPAWHTEDLDEIGVAVQATEKLSDWLDEPNRKLLAYFDSMFSGVKPHRARMD
jgi:hypothetical protein